MKLMLALCAPAAFWIPVWWMIRTMDEPEPEPKRYDPFVQVAMDDLVRNHGGMK